VIGKIIKRWVMEFCKGVLFCKMKKMGLYIFFCMVIVPLLISCKADEVSDISPDIEVVRSQPERTYYENLEQIEEQASVIVKASVSENLGQEVDTTYDYVFQKEMPTYGYSKWEVEVSKVYKGDVNVGDKLILLQEYYIWTKSDGKKQLVTSSSVKPVKKGEEYLLLLRYEELLGGYSTVGDYQGIYAIPTEEIVAKIEEGTLVQADFDIYYDDEPLNYLIPIYNEITKRYFDLNTTLNY